MGKKQKYYHSLENNEAVVEIDGQHYIVDIAHTISDGSLLRDKNVKSYCRGSVIVNIIDL